MASLRRIIGGSGTDAASRLGLQPDAPYDGPRAAFAAAQRWRRRAEHPAQRPVHHPRVPGGRAQRRGDGRGIRGARPANGSAAGGGAVTVSVTVLVLVLTLVLTLVVGVVVAVVVVVVGSVVVVVVGSVVVGVVVSVTVSGDEDVVVGATDRDVVVSGVNEVARWVSRRP